MNWLSWDSVTVSAKEENVLQCQQNNSESNQLSVDECNNEDMYSYWIKRYGNEIAINLTNTMNNIADYLFQTLQNISNLKKKMDLMKIELL